MQQLFGCLANCCEAGRKLKKLARSQVPDSDCDYDEVSSCYRCWLCQIWEISTAPPTHTKASKAGQLRKQRGSAASVPISSTTQAGCWVQDSLKHPADRLLRLHVLFLVRAWFPGSGSKSLKGLCEQRAVRDWKSKPFSRKFWIQTTGGDSWCRKRQTALEKSAAV